VSESFSFFFFFFSFLSSFFRTFSKRLVVIDTSSWPLLVLSSLESFILVGLCQFFFFFFLSFLFLFFVFVFSHTHFFSRVGIFSTISKLICRQGEKKDFKRTERPKVRSSRRLRKADDTVPLRSSQRDPRPDELEESEKLSDPEESSPHRSSEGLLTTSSYPTYDGSIPSIMAISPEDLPPFLLEPRRVNTESICSSPFFINDFVPFFSSSYFPNSDPKYVPLEVYACQRFAEFQQQRNYVHPNLASKESFRSVIEAGVPRGDLLGAFLNDLCCLMAPPMTKEALDYFHPPEKTFKVQALWALSMMFTALRYIFSVFLLLGSLGILLYGIVMEKSSFWPESVPWQATLVIMLSLLWVLGVLEGLQVAMVELCKNPPPEEIQRRYSRANKIQKLMSEGNNFEKFVLGRQVLVVVVVFFLAKFVTFFFFSFFFLSAN
jgi:hypothetical protein